MVENSSIEWTDHTFNPWEGCQKVAPECDHCYAENRDRRFTGGAHWGPRAPRRRTSPQNWAKPLRWNRAADAFEAAHGRRQRVFCASLADVFDNAVDPAWRADLWELIRACDRLDWLLLTKRPQNIRKMLPDDWGDGWPNVWLGTSAGTQRTADQNIPALLAVPATIHFLSAEPLLGPVDLQSIDPTIYAARINALNGRWKWENGPYRKESNQLDWVICGGESGPKARPMHPDWARGLRDQCRSADVRFFFKQWGEWLVEVDRDRDDPDWRANYCRAKRDGWTILNLAGGRGFHGERVCLMKRGRTAHTGRLLDDREWNEVPN